MKLARQERILTEVLEKIRPSSKTARAVNSLSGSLVTEIATILGQMIPGGLVEVEGSVAKGTYLENQHDIDVFAFFPPETPREKLEEIVLELGRRWAERRKAPYQIAYAEHPYVTVSISHDGLPFDVDVVGGYLIGSTSKLQSAVDRTRFHTDWVRSRVNPELRDQILLAKQFMKGTGVYGSEVRTGGFSGLLCEVLVLNYGSFLDLLKAASEWQPGQVIDIEHLSANPAKFSAPLVVIDPTDGRRNAGAAVSLGKMAMFIHASRSFLEDPKESYFFPPARRPLSRSALLGILRERGTRIYLLEFCRPPVIDDILYPQLDRMIGSLRRQLAEAGFTTAGPEAGSICEEGDTLYVLFEAGIASLPKIEKRAGPRIDRPDHVRSFLLKHSRNHPYLEGDRWCVDAPRRFSDAEQLLSHILSSNPQGMLPSHLAAAMAKGFGIRVGRDAILSSSRKVLTMLTEHFAPLLPWESG